MTSDELVGEVMNNGTDSAEYIQALAIFMELYIALRHPTPISYQSKGGISAFVPHHQLGQRNTRGSKTDMNLVAFILAMEIVIGGLIRREYLEPFGISEDEVKAAVLNPDSRRDLKFTNYTVILFIKKMPRYHLIVDGRWHDPELLSEVSRSMSYLIYYLV